MQYLDVKLFGIGKHSSTLFYHHKLCCLLAPIVLLEHLDLSVILLWASVELILCMTIQSKYFHLFNAKLQFLDNHFSKISPIFPKILLAKLAQPWCILHLPQPKEHFTLHFSQVNLTLLQ